MSTRVISQKLKLEGEKEFNDAVKSIDSNIKTLNSELSKTKEQYKNNKDSTEYFTKAQETLNKKLEEQRKKVEEIRKYYDDHKEALEGNADAMNAWQRKLNDAERALHQTENQVDDLTESEKENEATVGDLINSLGIKLPAGADKALQGFTDLSLGSAKELAVIVAAVKAVIDITKQMVEELNEAAAYADDVNTTATTSSLSTELIQTLNYMEDLADIDPSTVTSSINKLAKAMYEASEGSATAQEKFEALGVSYQNADGTLRDSYDVFLDCVDALGQVSTQTERAALEQELFGRSGTDLNTVVALGSEGFKEYAKEASNVGYVLDGKALTALNDYNDAVDRSKKSLDALTNQLSAQLAPGMQKIVEGWQSIRDAFLKFIEESNIVELLGDIGGLIGEIMSVAGDLLDFLEGSFGPGLGLVVDLIDAIIDGITWILDKIDALFDGLNTLLGITGKQASANASLASTTSAAKQATDALTSSAQSNAQALNSTASAANTAQTALERYTASVKAAGLTSGRDSEGIMTMSYDEANELLAQNNLDPNNYSKYSQFLYAVKEQMGDDMYWYLMKYAGTYDPTTGVYASDYNSATTNYTAAQLAYMNKKQTLPAVNSWNASGTDSFGGGLTWVGENGPELVSLPQGTQIYNAQESRAMSGGDTYNITIDAASVKEFSDIVRIVKNSRMAARMG